MKIDLEVEEEVEITVEQACEYVVWGERNEEGTMIIKWRNKNANPSLCETHECECGHDDNCHENIWGLCNVVDCQCAKFSKKSQDALKGCKKKTFWADKEYFCGQFEDLKHSDHIILCDDCRKKSLCETNSQEINKVRSHPRDESDSTTGAEQKTPDVSKSKESKIADELNKDYAKTKDSKTGGKE